MDSRDAARQRDFIARQACETCRIRKTRCDEDFPCGLCKSLNVECTYGVRKATKNEVSLSRVFGILKRMEKKLDALPTGAAAQPFSTNQIPSETSSNDISSPAGRAEENTTSFYKTAPPTEAIFSLSKTRIPFSTHMILDAIADAPCFPENSPFKNDYHKLASPAALELSQQSMYMDLGATVPLMLATLPFMTIKELSNAYFATWNRVYPIVDRDYYFAYTLNLVAQDGFDYNIESCVVLMVMALGCLGRKAYIDGEFSDKGAACLDPLDPYISRFLEEPVPGESLVTESSKRIGSCLCDTSIQSCQYYLLRATFYEQLAKPMDEWMMITRACTVSVALSKYASCQLDEWKADMQSRLFWICLLREAVVVDEMELVPSGLQDLAEQTPLPRFVRYPIHRPRAKDNDDSHYHYHFLAQLALRIIITRIRNELYTTEPSPFVAEELFSQLYQWRDNLPIGLRFSKNNTTQPHEPAEAVATMLLRTRYTLAIYHISRPFLIKAIRFPLDVTDHEIRICSEAMKCAMEWPIADGKCRQLKTFMPVKYFACAQIFGQLLIIHALEMVQDDRFVAILPAEYAQKSMELIEFMSETAPNSPSIAQDIAILSSLCFQPWIKESSRSLPDK